MFFSKRLRSHHPEEFHVPEVRFLGEQDGPPEQALKQRLSIFFHRDRSVLAAYLARVDFGGEPTVALCLRTEFGEDRGLAEKIGAIFAAVFNAQAHLDIVFLDIQQEQDVAKVCASFFVSRSDR